jgi:hypothetical protein
MSRAAASAARAAKLLRDWPCDLSFDRDETHDQNDDRHGRDVALTLRLSFRVLSPRRGESRNPPRAKR